jgi:hypothetical protein
MNTLYFSIPDCRVIRPTADSATFINDLEVWSDTLGLIMSRRYDEGEYNLVACRINGKIYGSAGYIQTGISDATPRKQSFRLEQNYPNPFNPSTIIRYTLEKQTYVQLKVYDMLGKEVAILVEGEQKSGLHEVSFSAEGLSAGVYIYRLRSGERTESRKMILLK